MTGEQWLSEDAFCRRPRLLKLVSLAAFYGRNSTETVIKERILFLIFKRVIATTYGDNKATKAWRDRKVN